MRHDDLNDNEAWPFLDGANEVVVRVLRYDHDKPGSPPAAYQALVRGKNRTQQWGVGVRSNPVAALKAAIETFYRPGGGADPVEIAEQERQIALSQHPGPLPAAVQEADVEPSIEDLLGD